MSTTSVNSTITRSPFFLASISVLVMTITIVSLATSNFPYATLLNGLVVSTYAYIALIMRDYVYTARLFAIALPLVGFGTFFAMIGALMYFTR